MAVKFGLSQISEQTPIVYQRIETAVTMFLIPAITAFIMSIVVDKTQQTHYIAGLVLFTAVIKAVGACLGVTDSNAVVTQPTNSIPSKN